MSIATDIMEVEQLRCGWHLAGKDGFCLFIYIKGLEMEYFSVSCSYCQVAETINNRCFYRSNRKMFFLPLDAVLFKWAYKRLRLFSI